MNIKLIFLILLSLVVHISVYGKDFTLDKTDRYKVKVSIFNFTFYLVTVETKYPYSYETKKYDIPTKQGKIFDSRKEIFRFNIDNSLINFGITSINLVTNKGLQTVLNGNSVFIKFFDDGQDKCGVKLLNNYRWDGIEIWQSDVRCSLKDKYLEFTINISHKDHFKCPIPG